MDEIADLTKIKWLIENVSGYRIEKETGVSQSTISRLKLGQAKFDNMRLGHAIKLTNYALSLQNDNPNE